MMLSNQTIRRRIEEGAIHIHPYNPDNIGPASYDLRLADSFCKIVPQVTQVPAIVSADTPQYRGFAPGVMPKPMKAIIKTRRMDESYPVEQVIIPKGEVAILPPKGFVLASTEEEIRVPNDIAVYVEGRSSIGRMGLQIQNAGFVDPGFSGRLTLELFNASDIPIALIPGRRVCQITFIQLDMPTNKIYTGKYVNQYVATPSHIELDNDSAQYDISNAKGILL